MAMDGSDGGEAVAYHLSLSGTGISVDRDVPEEVALAVVSLVMGGSGVLPGRAGTSALAARVGSQLNPVSGDTVGEFVQASDASTIPEKIAAIGVFLADYRDKSVFSRGDVKAQFRAAFEPNPSNFPRDFQKAVRSRWIAASDGSKDAFFVTNTGRNAVVARFEGSSRQVASRPIRRRPRKSPANTPAS